jgi:glutamine---fructose-6-phosphate transaminase (isomerizing)
MTSGQMTSHQGLLPPPLAVQLGHTPAHITLLGCGSSFYAAWACKTNFEKLCPVTLELASEFHYRTPPMSAGITIALSQSGETADTLKAAEYAKAQGQVLVAVVNTPHSSLARMADFVAPIHAGPEIGVASTKAFMAQMLVLTALAQKDSGGLKELQSLPEWLDITLEKVLLPIQSLAQDLAPSKSLLFLGRGLAYPLALEAALKVKELAYIHSEALPAGELKHGPIALIDGNLPVVVIAPWDTVFEKTLSNMHEISARGGKLIVLTDEKGLPEVMKVPGVHATICIPYFGQACQPFLMALPIQLLAYFTALALGRSIDKPRNLAKSVTVE